MEVGRVANQHSRYPDGSRGCAECSDCDTMFEPLHQFFQDEDGACDWRVEGGGKACASPSRNQNAAVRLGPAE